MTDDRKLELALRQRITRRAARNWQLIVATGMLVAAVGFVQFSGTSERTDIGNLARQTSELAANTAINFCAFKRNLVDTQAATDAFIVEVKTGRRHLPDGITLADIAIQRRNRQRTIDSLSSLECPPADDR